jgi:pilus assembly protein CpaE
VPEEITILIVDSDDRSRATIRGLLANMPLAAVAGEAPDIKRGLKLVKQLKPNLVIMELSPVKEALEAAEKIKIEYPRTSVFVTASDPGADVILMAMRAGASEFLSRPVSGTDLGAGLKKLGSLLERDAAVSTEAGKVVTVFSNKGGVGATTIAANLAVSLAQETDQKVVIADLDLELGDVTMFLNMKPRYTIMDVVSRGPRLDSSSVHSALAKHDSGVFVLGEPAKPEDAEAITPEQVGQLLTHLRRMFSYVVVDTAHTFEERTLEVLDVSDLILLVVLLDLPNIRNVQRCLDVFDRIPGYDSDKVKLLVNRYVPDLQIGTPQVQQALKTEVYWKIPNDYGPVISSVNSGTPLVMMDGESPVSASFKNLARDIAGLPPLEEPAEKKKKQRSSVRLRLFGGKGNSSDKGED